MQPNEARIFQALLTALAEYFPNSRPNMDAIVEGYFDDLSTLSLQHVASVFTQARQQCQFFPTIKELRELAGLAIATDGHPGPEEAWALYPKTEADSALVTDEIMAAGAVAADMIDQDDLVAARMAFLEVYRQQLARARLEHRQARWWVSLGMDPQGRVAVLTQGVAQGKITASHALQHAGGQYEALATALARLPGSQRLELPPPLSADEARTVLHSINETLQAQGAAPLSFHSLPRRSAPRRNCV